MASNKQTSIRVFRKYITLRDTDGELDASQVLSRECYEEWRTTRKSSTQTPERQFQRSISAHISALDGRAPFTPEEEQAVLVQVRRRSTWPCFLHSEDATVLKIGMCGFRGKGFHEKQRSTPPVPNPEPVVEEIPAVVVPPPVPPPIIVSPQPIVSNHSDEESIAYWQTYVGSLEEMFMQHPEAFWSHLGQVWKYVLYARTSACSVAWFTKDRADLLCAAYSQQHPGNFVSVSTAFSNSYSSQVLAENKESVEIFGSAIGHGRNGFLRFQDVVRLFRPLAQSYFNLGTCFPFETEIEVKPGVWIQIKANYVVDPESLFLTIFGTPT